MSFFDSKQEVLDIQLTHYGRYLLSKGKFKPKYYAFYDGDILYDTHYTAITESQNASQTRILDETPYSKAQYNYGGKKDAPKDFANQLSSSIAESQIIGNDNFALINELGTSDLSSKYAPSWNLQVLNGYINTNTTSQFTNQGTGSIHQLLKHPQINLNDGIFTLKTIKDIDNLGEDEEVYAMFGDDIVVSSQKDCQFLLEISENNTSDEKENFDIEVFIEEDIQINNTSKKELRQLFFFDKPKVIKNKILLDNPEFPDELEPTIRNVEYYLNITVDEEIVDLPDEKKKNITSGIYETNINLDDGPFGKDC